MSPRDFSRAVVLSDFDETIVNIDTARFALEHFADPSWKRIEEQFEKGVLTFEESLRKEFAMIGASEKAILNELDKVVVLRPNFAMLVDYCRTHRLSFIIVSGGLEFCIHHFLNRGDWLEFLEIYAPKVKYADDGYQATFPELFDKSSINFKHDLVKRLKAQGKTVYYVGDGLGDLPAAKDADFPFAIMGSKLAEECRKGKVEHMEITDFQEVVNAIGDLKG